MRKNSLLLSSALIYSPAIVHSSAYANNLDALIGPIYAALNVVSREMVGFIPSVSRNSNAELASVGKGVTYNIAPAATGGDIVADMNYVTPDDKTNGTGQMLMTNAKFSNFYLTGEEQLGLSNGAGAENVVVDNIAESFRYLTNLIEQDIAALAIQAASRAVGVPGTTPFAGTDLKDVALVRQILDDNGAPKTGRSMVINSTSAVNLRSKPELNKANEAGSTMTLRQGEILDLHGFSIKETGASVDHAAGDAANATTDNAGYAVGTTVINLAATGTGAVLVGDVVTVAGDPNAYMIETGLADVSAGGAIKLTAPGLRVAIPASAQALTLKADFASNVAFSRDAIHLATRIPAAPKEGDIAIDKMIVTDQRSGLVFEIRVIPGNRMVSYEIAIVWGAAAIKPAHIGLLMG